MPTRGILRSALPHLVFAAVVAARLPAAEPARPDPHLLKKVGEFHLLQARQGATAVARGNYIYVLGGNARGALTDIERFDVHTHQIVSLTDKLLPRRYHSAVEYNGRIYIFGGQGFMVGNEVYEDRVEIFDLAKGTITAGTPMPVPRGHMTCVKFGAHVYLVGGTKVRERAGSGQIQTSDNEIYDLDKDTWSKGAPLPTGRESSGVVVGDFLIVAGGFRSPRSLDLVDVFDPKENTWRALPPLSRTVSAASTVFLDPYIFLFGDYAKFSSVLAYDLHARTSIDLQTEFRGVRHATAVVVEKLIYVIGGNTTETGGESDWIQVFALTPAPASPPPAR